jgi:heme-degrading monooxygenase HmoA
MDAVIFEVEPKPGKAQEDLDIAVTLRPELDKIDGFISIARFERVYHPGRFVSLSFWRDEDVMHAWRAHVGHQSAQQRGRSESSSRITAYACPRFCESMAWSTDRKHRSEPNRPGASLSNAESITPNGQVSGRGDGNRHPGVTFHLPHLLYLMRA